jgi:hypothetical protein
LTPYPKDDPYTPSTQTWIKWEPDRWNQDISESKLNPCQKGECPYGPNFPHKYNASHYVEREAKKYDFLDGIVIRTMPSNSGNSGTGNGGTGYPGKGNEPIFSTGSSGGGGTVVRSFIVNPVIDHWQDEPKDEVFTPSGNQIQENDRGQQNPFRVDTVVQMDDGIAQIQLNRRDIRHKITAPSLGTDPIILITGKGTDTTSYTYRGSVVALKDNEYIQITSSDTLDASWVYVTMLMK